MIKRMWSTGKSRLYDRAIGLFNQGRYRQAIRLFQKIIADSAGSGGLRFRLASFYCAQAYCDLGRILFAMGNYLGALQEFKQVLRIDPERTQVYEYMGRCYEKIGAQDNARKVYGRIAEMNPWNQPARLKVVSAFHRLGIWDRVEAACLKHLQQYPLHADLHYTLGLTYLGTGKPLLAISALEQAVAINPEYWPARIRLGATYAAADEPEKADRQFSLILERFPEYVDLYHHLGVVHAGRKKDLGAALKWFQKAVSENPNFTDARIKLAVLLCAAGHNLEGIRILREGNRLDPEDESLALLLEFFEKGRSLSVSESEENGAVEELLAQTIGAFGKNLVVAPSVVEMLMLTRPIEDENLPRLLEQVIEAVQCAAHLYARYPDFQWSIGSLHYRAGKLEQAETAFREALLLNPTYTRAQIMLFKTLKAAGKTQAALEVGDILVDQRVLYPDFLRSFGELCFRTKAYQKAEGLFRKTLELRPDDDQAHIFLKQLLEKNRDL